MKMVNDSVSIAANAAKQQLDALGSQALYTPHEIEKIIKASFMSLRATEDEKVVLERGILSLIDRAAERAKELGSDYAI